MTESKQTYKCEQCGRKIDNKYATITHEDGHKTKICVYCAGLAVYNPYPRSYISICPLCFNPCHNTVCVDDDDAYLVYHDCKECGPMYSGAWKDGRLITGEELKDLENMYGAIAVVE